MSPCTLIQIELQMEISLFNMFVHFTSFNMKEIYTRVMYTINEG